MKQERRKVLEMLADGCINSAEAQLLLDTLDELQIEAQTKQDATESVWNFLLDLRDWKIMSQERANPNHYISWRPV